MIDRQLDEASLQQEDLPTLDLPRLGIGPEHYEAIGIAVRELSRQGIEVRMKK